MSKIIKISFIFCVCIVIILLIYFFNYYNYKLINSANTNEGFTSTNKINPDNTKDEQNESTKINEKNDKIAFCFLTMGDIHQLNVWKDFFKGHENKYNIYIHPKEYDKVSNSHKKYVIRKRLKTNWGDVSLVNATLELYREAYKDSENKLFVLISDSCIPLYNFDYVYNYLITTNSNICPIHYFEPPKLKHRYTALKDVTFLPYKKFQKTSQWCIMKRDTIEFLIDQDNDYTDLYTNMFAPDEHYFINLFDKFHIKYLNNKVTFDNWNEESENVKHRPLPKTYLTVSIQDINKARKEGCLFFRKVCPETHIDTNYLFNTYDEE
jgi:hypothetical protein